MENPVNKLIQDILEQFVNPSEDYSGHIDIIKSVSTLIRVHSEKLALLGEISFPSKPEIWFNHFKNSREKLNENALRMLKPNEFGSDEQKLHFLEIASTWYLPVERLTINPERCLVHLKRIEIIKQTVSRILTDKTYGQLKKSEHHYVYIEKLEEDTGMLQNLSFSRMKLLYNVLENVVRYSKWIKASDLDTEQCLNLKLQSVRDSQGSQENVVVVKCGLVVDPLTNGSLCKMPTKEYLSLRSNDMCLMAMHKYGVRVKQDARFCALMSRLGSAAVTVDLLEVRHSSPVKIIRCGQGSSKGASFILYNSARLESLLRSFDERVANGDYESLPPLNSINWELLNEEEWQLVFVYLNGFPDLIERCLDQLERGLCAIHLIIRFLNNMVGVFSIFYRRTRILTEKRDHLMPAVYAHIYLIKAVREILNKTLLLLDIEPVEFM
uniref:DALR anticodon binding domain-containing protein n=1 Tax=Glossina brevipalpis TaxID=37001 RepID=A0A1A9W8P2_9MUSC